MSIGALRNCPCWCGSGKKFKHCHLRRAEEKRVDLAEVIAEQKRADKKYCLHPRAAKGVCGGNIVRAHSIQRNGNGLKQIAVDSHVYTIDVSTTGFVKRDGALGLLKTGIGKATTFTGFCSHHDKLVFLPIEDRPLEVTKETCFLLGYRAVCRELFAKRRQTDMLKFGKTLDRGLDVIQQVAHQQEFKLYSGGVIAGLEDIDDSKKRYDDVLLSNSFEDSHFFAVELSKTPELMCSGSTQLENDFGGKVLQGIEEYANHGTRLDALTFTMCGTESGGLAVFQWVGENTSADKFIQSFIDTDDNVKGSLLIQFCFETFENIAISIEWWDSLNENLKNCLSSRMEAGASLEVARDQDSLVPDGRSYTTNQVIGAIRG